MLGPPKSSTTVRSNAWFFSTERLLQEGLKLLGRAQVAVCGVGNGKAVGAKGIDAHLLEVAGAGFVLEQHVELGRGAALGLGESEEGPEQGQDAEGAPDEAAFALQVPGGRVEDRGVDVVGHEGEGVVAGA